MAFDMTFDLPGHIQGQMTGYRISSQNYVSTLTKMVLKDNYHPSAAYMNMAFDLTFGLPDKIKGQRTEYRKAFRNFVRTYTKMVSNDGYWLASRSGFLDDIRYPVI